MRKIFTLLFCFIGFLASCQSWQLFPLHQQSHYRNNSDTLLIDSYQMDSLITNGTTSWGLFNYGDLKNTIKPCTTISSGFATYLYYYTTRLYDTLRFEGDTVFNSGFYFLPKCIVNQSWSIVSQGSGGHLDSVTIKCISIQPETFLGITDSVKTFSLTSNFSYPGFPPISNFQLKLSKNYGLVKLMPFTCFYQPAYSKPVSYNLVGINNNSSIGFSQPGFSDYFHLNAGDVLLWKREYDAFSIVSPDFIEYFTDSISNSLITPDSVVYTIDRTTLNRFGNIVYQNGLIEKYLKHDFEELFASNCKSVANGGGRFSISLSWFPDIWSSSEFRKDTSFFPATGIIGRDYSLGYYVDTSSCMFNEYIDASNYFYCNTLTGVSAYAYTNFDVDFYSLLGSTINGVTYNRLPVLPVGIFNQVHSKELIVSPNPVKDILFLNGNTSEIQDYKITEITGKTILYGIHNSNSIDVKELGAGIYFLILRTKDNSSSVIKFIRQ